MPGMSSSFASAARKITRAAENVANEVQGDGLRAIGEEIRTDVEASRPGAGVPRDEGNLASTLTVVGPRQGVVTLRAGGAAAPYALKQHEELSYAHNVGEARYWVRGTERWSTDGSSAWRALQANAAAGIAAAGAGP